VPITTAVQVRTTDLDIKLQKVIVETYKKKVQKNSKVKTQTVFYVDLAYSANAKNNITIKASDINLLEVKDNNGKSYPVLSIKPANTQIKPDTKITIIIRANKSPLIWGSAKSMQVIFKKGIFGLKSSVILSQRIDDFEEKNVDGFD
jgi:diphthamide biosynthesis methyltransferase